MQTFCAANNLEPPPVYVRTKAEWHFGVCAYYRPTKIEMCLDRCALIGTAGMAWSYPGNTVDRTAFGVVQHELGHHVDVTHSTFVDRYRGDFSIKLRKAANEKPISGYCPDDGEWFAEMFRLFVTNPDLLRLLRPNTHALLCDRFVPVVTDAWSTVLGRAPERTKLACANKISAAHFKNARRDVHALPGDKDASNVDGATQKLGLEFMHSG